MPCPNSPCRKQYDVIIVLGSALLKGGKAGPALRRRVLHGVKLLKKNIANFLLLTGGLGKYPPTEARVMKDLAIKAGGAIEKIILEERATSTFANAIYCSHIMREKNWTTAIVVSDSYHLLRTMIVFRSFGIRATGSATPGAKNNYPHRKWLYFHIREFVAILWYFVLIAAVKITGFRGRS